MTPKQQFTALLAAHEVAEEALNQGVDLVSNMTGEPDMDALNLSPLAELACHLHRFVMAFGRLPQAATIPAMEVTQ